MSQQATADPLQRPIGNEPSQELRIVNPDPRYSKVRQIEPTTLGYLYVAATVRPGPIPLVLPSVDRSSLLVRLKELARGLERLDAVVKATVFRALVIPPTARLNAYLRERGTSVRVPRFDVVVLVETTSPEATRDVQAAPAYDALMDALRSNAEAVQVIAARNAKRIGDVDKSRQGLFLFNHFVADDASVGLALWDYLADWFAVETGLDNSILLVPLDGERSTYAFVNHARWDVSLPQFLWHQLSKKSFRSYVLANLEANRVGSLPVLYRLA
ncbi:MAG: hypothetical protein ACRDI2_17675 [Chloroflexota bacterium]